MLNFTDFKKEFITTCKNDISSLACRTGCDNIEIEERSVTKAQQGKLTGLVFRSPDTAAAPTYYVEDIYSMYRDGTPMDRLSLEIAQNAYHFIHEAPPFPVESAAEAFEEPGNLRVRLINKKRNRELLQDVPYSDAGCGLVMIAEVRSGDFRAVVTRGLLESFEMSSGELMDRALENTEFSDPAFLADLSEMLVSGQDNCENLLGRAPGEVLPLPDSLYVLSNDKFFWGASALFYTGMTRRLTELMGGDFYVLPSSVHEVLLLPVSEGDPYKLAETIHEGNRTVVSSSDFLADDLMICESGKLRRVNPGKNVN